MNVEIQLDTRAFELEVQRQARQSIDRLGMAVLALAETAMTLAKADYVPVRTGFLRSSGWVDSRYVIVGGEIQVNLGFNTNYAEKVHEGPGSVIGRNPARPLAGRKYLERSMLEVMATAETRIAAFLAGGGTAAIA